VYEPFFVFSEIGGFLMDKKPTNEEMEQRIKELEVKALEGRQAEEVLRESEARYRSIFEHTGAATVIIEEDTTLSMANTRFENLSGYSKKEIESRMKWTDFVAGEDLERMKEYHVKRREDKCIAPNSYEFRLVDRQGNIKNILLSVGMIPGTKQSVVSLTDVTYFKQTEEKLRESEARYRAIFENNPVQTIVVDNEGKIKDVNLAKKNSGDRMPDIGKVMYKDYAGKHEIDMHTRLMKCIRSRRIKRFGKLRYGDKVLSVIIAPFSNGAIITSEDITEIKRIEEQTRKNMDMLQEVFNGIKDPLFTVEKDLSVKMFNKAASEYYQVAEPKNVLGKPCYQAFMGRSGPCEGCNILLMVSKSKGGTFRREIMDPSILEKITVYPLKEESSKVGVAIIQVTDSTETRQIERQLMQSEKLASLGLLVAGIAHEINNPNNFISFNIPILRDYLNGLIPIIDDYVEDHQDFGLFGMSYPEFRKDIFKLLDNMEHGSCRINATVSRLKEFIQRRDRGEKRRVNLKKVIENVVDICQAQIKKMVKTLEVSVPKDLPPIFTDPQALEQILINLLINAAQAADKEDSCVRINVVPEKTRRNRLMIEVKDNGCGMDDETTRKIFDPFFTSKAPGTGTGLGLYVCHNLIDGIGGLIKVESKPGKGSTFTVILPG
jgi:PAS domain S-box-containing protein